MRDILFKGKDIDGKWVEGYYIVDEMDESKAYIGYVFDSDGRYPHDTDIVMVDKSTVCQYTGLTDKNGRKIFEGDIVKVCTFGFNSERFITEVIYEKCAFRLKNGRSMFYFGQSDFTKMDDAKVIGNIFDNPELLKE